MVRKSNAQLEREWRIGAEEFKKQQSKKMKKIRDKQKTTKLAI